MQQQRVILHSEQVARKGEIMYFQIPLQGKPIKIVGVEVGAFLFSSLPNVNPISQPGPVPAPQPAPAHMSGCPNPCRASIDGYTMPVTDSTKTEQVFKVGDAVNPGFIYSCGVYSVVLSVTAVDGDTPSTIATKLADLVNNTTLAEWNQYGGNNQNYKPSASSNGALLTLITDRQHSFFASGTGECSGAPPPPPPSQLLDFDPLFKIVRNERAGVLSLQSPDATDIFYQCDAWRLDNNINYGDFTMKDELQGEWLKGRNRIAPEVSITTASPILEAYYKDSWGVYYDRDISYGVNIFIWFENLSEQ
jgi:hypothetical protein